MNLFKNLFAPSQKRSLINGFSVLFRHIQTVEKSLDLKTAVEKGYIVNPWVYVGIRKIAQATSRVPIVVKGPDNSVIENHKLSKTLQKFNSLLSQRESIEILVAHLCMVGEAYLYNTQDMPTNGQRVPFDENSEIIPIPPNRLKAKLHSDLSKFIDYYYLDYGLSTQKELSPNKIVSFLYNNPYKPAQGVGPLHACGHDVDAYRELSNFVARSAKNNGLIDTVIFSKNELDPNDWKQGQKLINEHLRNPDQFGMPLFMGMGSDAKSLSALPKDMDYIQGFRFLKTVILDTIGVPTEIFASEQSTYNNKKTAVKFFYQETVVSYITQFCDGLDFYFNTYFTDALNNGEYIHFDSTEIPELQDDKTELYDAGKKLYDMDVPFSEINRLLGLGIQEYPGWDVPKSQKNQAQQVQAQQRNDVKKNTRQLDGEFQDKESFANEIVKNYVLGILTEIEKQVLENADEWEETLISIGKDDDYIEEIKSILKIIAERYSENINIRNYKPTQRRNAFVDQLIEQQINEQLVADQITAELSDDLIQDIKQYLKDNLQDGQGITSVQQALVDMGIASETKAQLMARTLSATGQSIGQLSGAINNGATHKIWVDSGFNVRPSHQSANGQTVEINGFFTVGGYACQYPGDPALPKQERYNCRCSMDFEIRE